MMTWIKNNRVFFASLLLAVLTAVVPSIQQETISWYAVGVGGSIAAIGWFTRNMTGQIASILGTVGAVLTNFYMAHPEPSGITAEYVVKTWALPLIIQLIGAAIGPKKQEG